MQEYRQAIALEPTNIDGYLGLVIYCVLERLGCAAERTKVTGIADRLAKEKNPSGPIYLAVLHSRIGDVKQALNDMPEALTHYQASAAISASRVGRI